MKKIAKNLLLMSVLATPVTAYSLGIGEVTLHSSLHQKLDAEIVLSLSENEKLDGLKVGLASVHKFEQAGVVWHYFLSNIKFELVQKDAKTVLVKMTSSQYVKEPFLNFLLEVSDLKGESFKEFTVLFDPFIDRSVPIAKIKPFKIKDQLQGSDLIEKKIKARIQPTAESFTKRYDTLWSIAKKLNQDSTVSTHQYVLALYSANPNAFYNSDINRLMAGKLLKIPKKSDIIKLSKEDAKIDFYKKAGRWKKLSVKKDKGTFKKEPKSLVQLGVNSVQSGKSLVLEAPTKEINSTVSRDDIQEREELKSRIVALEEKFSIIEKMLRLKEVQLKTLQKKEVLSIETEVNDVSVSLKHNEVSKEEVHEDIKQPGLNGLAKIKKLIGDKPEKELLVDEVNKKRADQALLAPKQDNKVPDSAMVPTTPPPPVISSDEDYTVWVLSFFVLLVFTGSGWYLWRKKQKSDVSIGVTDTDTDNVIDNDILFDEGFEEFEFDSASVGDPLNEDESTILENDFDIFDDVDVDDEGEYGISGLVSESDVYLAHERYEESEKIMLQALEESPDNDEYKLKYLRIFSLSANKISFEHYEQQLQDEGYADNTEFWLEVQNMKRDMLAAIGPESIEQRAEELSDENKSTEYDFDLDEVSLGDASSAIEKEKQPEDSIEPKVKVKTEIESLVFNLEEDVLDEVEPVYDVEQTEQSESIEMFDFDLETTNESKTSSTDIIMEEESQDFSTEALGLDDFDFSEEETEANDLLADNALALSNDDSGLDGFDLETTNESKTSSTDIIMEEESQDFSTEALGLDDFDFSEEETEANDLLADNALALSDDDSGLDDFDFSEEENNIKDSDLLADSELSLIEEDSSSLDDFNFDFLEEDEADANDLLEGNALFLSVEEDDNSSLDDFDFSEDDINESGDLLDDKLTASALDVENMDIDDFSFDDVDYAVEDEAGLLSEKAQEMKVLMKNAISEGRKENYFHMTDATESEQETDLKGKAKEMKNLMAQTIVEKKS